MIKKFRNILSNWVFAYSIEKYKTSMFFTQARQYANYWDLCKKNCKISIKKSDLIVNLTDEFVNKGFTSLKTIENNELASSIYKKIKKKEKLLENIWKKDSNYKEYSQNLFYDFEELEKLFKGELGDLLHNIFKCDFNIFRGKMVHSSRTDKNDAEGSQLWHNDGNPGICINVMFYITRASNKMGAIEILHWDKSKQLLIERRSILKEGLKKVDEASKVDKKIIRKMSTDFYMNKIDNDYKKFVETPTGDPGMVCLFLNNTIHKGGFPAIGKERYVCIFQCYPSASPADFKYYKKNGFGAAISYPRNIEKELR